MNVDLLLQELFSMTFTSAIKPGTSRVLSLCSAVGNPLKHLHAIHVAGTNGKGSTCAMLASILQCAGYKVGLYTSPHIRRFNERIRINGEAISDATIMRLAPPLMEHAKQIGGTFFEVTTALAFLYFAEQNTDVAIIETGLGGRYDATNIISPLLSIITSIDYDHTEYLGTSLDSIASEKAGIIKPDTPVVLGPRIVNHDTANRTRVADVFRQEAARNNAPIIFTANSVQVDVDSIHSDLTMQVSVIWNETLSYFNTELAGKHQADNIATVLCAVQQLQGTLFIGPEHIRLGLLHVRESTGMAGRIQRIGTDSVVVLDVSHNPSGIACLCTTLLDAGYAPASWQVVFGAMHDKDIPGMLHALLPVTQSLHLCTPHIPRAAPVTILETLAQDAGFTEVHVHPSVAAACHHARSLGRTLICGSFHVADEALEG